MADGLGLGGVVVVGGTEVSCVSDGDAVATPVTGTAGAGDCDSEAGAGSGAWDVDVAVPRRATGFALGLNPTFDLSIFARQMFEVKRF